MYFRSIYVLLITHNSALNFPMLFPFFSSLKFSPLYVYHLNSQILRFIFFGYFTIFCHYNILSCLNFLLTTQIFESYSTDFIQILPYYFLRPDIVSYNNYIITICRQTIIVYRPDCRYKLEICQRVLMEC